MMAGNVHRLQTPQPEPWGGFLASDITDRPSPRQWIVDGIVPRKCVTLLAGSPSIGKSLLLMQMLASVSLGMPWIGVPTEQAKCVGFLLEDDASELKRRMWNISGSYREELERMYDLELNPRENMKTKIFEFPRGGDTPQLTSFGRLLWDRVETEGDKLIGLDTATLVFGGRVIIDIERITNCLRELTMLASRNNASIVITAHTKKDDPGGFGGPNAWLASVRAAMNMRMAVDEQTREPIRGQRILKDLGGNYSSWEPITLVWREGVWEPGQCEQKPFPRPKTQTERIELNYRLLTFLGKLAQRGAPVLADDIGDASLVRRVRRQEKIAYNDVSAFQEWAIDQGLAVLIKLNGKCHIRPRDARYEGEEPWRAIPKA